MRTARLALDLPTVELRLASESLPLRQSQLRGLLQAPQHQVGVLQQQGTARDGERALGSTWEFPEVFARMSRPMFPVIPQEYAEHSVGDSAATFPVDKIPNETCVKS